MSLLANPLAIAMPATPAVKLKGSSILITPCRGYVENNIKKRMEMITEALEISQSMASIGAREHTLLEHLQAYLKNEESFYLDTVLPFGTHVKQHDKNEKKTTRSPLQNPNHSIKCMLDRESEEPASHCPIM
jgi:hypothetical protein